MTISYEKVNQAVYSVEARERCYVWHVVKAELMRNTTFPLGQLKCRPEMGALVKPRMELVFLVLSSWDLRCNILNTRSNCSYFERRERKGRKVSYEDYLKVLLPVEVATKSRKRKALGKFLRYVFSEEGLLNGKTGQLDFFEIILVMFWARKAQVN